MQQKGSVGIVPVFLLRSAEILKVVLIFQKGGGGGGFFNLGIDFDPTDIRIRIHFFSVFLFFYLF
jgi:hypothetical protein